MVNKSLSLSLCCSGVCLQDIYYLGVVRVLFHHSLEILVTVVLKKQLPRLQTVVLVLFRGDTEEVTVALIMTGIVIC